MDDDITAVKMGQMKNNTQDGDKSMKKKIEKPEDCEGLYIGEGKDFETEADAVKCLQQFAPNVHPVTEDAVVIMNLDMSRIWLRITDDGKIVSSEIG